MNTKQNTILKRILKENEYNLITYWDYREELSTEQILKILKEEDGLNEIETELYFNSSHYIFDEIHNILKESLTDKEFEDEDLKDFLFEELESRWNMDINGLLKNSSIRLRVEFEGDEDFLDLDNYKNSDYWKYLKEVLKGYITQKDLKKEMYNFIGSSYGKFTFYFKVSGNEILKLRDELQKGRITLNKDINCGFHNSWLGCGGNMDLNLKRELTFNTKNWTRDKNEKYYRLSVIADSDNYGIDEVYGFVGEMWREY